MDVHEKFMMECFDLARKGLGRVSPNPMVGAVLVRKGRVMAKGYHKRFGGPHAEVNCLHNCKSDPRGATMYVNLEPCCYHGKTPPCTDLLIKTGIRRVVAAMKDPNPLVAGKGLHALRRAGVHVEHGVMETESMELNRWFITNMKFNRPFVHVKVAQTLDGRIASTGKQRQRISSRESHALVHQWRSTHDAVLVGAGTVIADDPRLDVRYTTGRNPAVIILDGRLSIPETSRALKNPSMRRIIVCTSTHKDKKSIRKLQRLQSSGIEIVSLHGDKDGHLHLKTVLARLYAAGIGSILVEGGAMTFGNFARSKLIDQLSIFVAPKVFGPGLLAFGESGSANKLFKAKHMTSRLVGQDILLQAFFA